MYYSRAYRKGRAAEGWFHAKLQGKKKKIGGGGKEKHLVLSKGIPEEMR